MLDGLGLAETTPGPLILVTEFVGFLAAHRHGGGNPWAMGVLGALVTLWATFAPCFLWIFAGAPYIERLNAEPRLKAALAAVTAAVVGVILNLTVWFALHVLFATVTETWAGPCACTCRPWHRSRGRPCCSPAWPSCCCSCCTEASSRRWRSAARWRSPGTWPLRAVASAVRPAPLAVHTRELGGWIARAGCRSDRHHVCQRR